jgi:phosphoribosylformimino-5-aminoimidazole carboxamide ribotide isomerase
MKPFHIIPAIDILNGKVVRLTQGDYNRVDHYSMNPVDTAKAFQDNGATRIHLVDLDGAKDGHLTNRKTFEAIRKSVSVPLELGGGIRSQENLTTLFDIGIDFLILGSLFIKDPELSLELCNTFPNKIIAGIDAHGENVAIQGWIESSTTTIESLLNTLKDTPLESIIYTDISKDGTLQGPNIHALKNIAQKTHHAIIASGGVGVLDDIKAIQTLPEKNIIGCIVGKALLSGKIPLNTLWK